MISFKTAQISDAEALNLLVNSAYRGESSKQGWTTEADILGGQRTDVQSLRDMICEPGSIIEMMFDQGDLVGCVYLAQKSEQDAYLGMLTVLPHLQGKGYGKVMLNHCEQKVLSWNCQNLKMDVIPLRTELVQFYNRRGYLSTGIEKPFPEEDPRFGLPKIKNLKFIELKKKLVD